MQRGSFYVFCLVLVSCLALPRAAVSQPYTFTKVVDNNTQRPGDAAGTLFHLTTATTPSFDGQWVVFRDQGPLDDGSLQAIFSYNTQDGTLRRLVDLKCRVPGGTGTFFDLEVADTAPSVRNGTVIFVAHPTGLAQGLYSIPAAGPNCAVTRIADNSTANPNGGTFGIMDAGGRQTGAFTFDGTTAAFRAQGSTLPVGTFSAKPDGTGIAAVADTLHPFSALVAKVTVFDYPAISGINVIVAGNDGRPINTGYNGLYLGKVGGAGAVTELVNSTQRLPGDPITNYHTRFDAPVFAIDGGVVAFHATDNNSSSLWSGLYWTDLTSHSINKIADTASTLPGLPQVGVVGGQGVAVSQGNVLFMAGDNASVLPKSALYVWANGVPTRVVGTGDAVGGTTVQAVSDPGPAALYGSAFAFNAFTGTTPTIYLAKPSGGQGPAAIVSNASYAFAAPLAPNAIATAFGQGLADATAIAPPPPLPLTLAGVGVTVTDSAGAARQAALYFVSAGQFNFVVPDGTAPGTALVSVGKNGLSPLQVAAVAPGLYSANGDGRGAAAAIAFKSQTNWQYTFNCGTAGNCVAAPFDVGAATETVYLELFGTGIRAGKSVTATVGGTSVTPAWAAQQQYPGMDQVNIPIPKSLAGAGEVDVVVTVDGVASNPVKVSIK